MHYDFLYALISFDTVHDSIAESILSWYACGDVEDGRGWCHHDCHDNDNLKLS